MDVRTERDLDAGVAVIRMRGELTPRNVTVVKAAVGKAAAECPAAVIVDLSELNRAAAAVVSIFSTLTHQARQTWGVPVLLCAVNEEIVRDLGPLRGSVALYETCADALVAVRAYVPRWACAHLPPTPDSVASARRLLSECCAAWDIAQLRERACLIVSEFATNAIQHTGAGFDVMASDTGVFLRIAVRDESTALPRMIAKPGTSGAIVPAGSGRGLRIVAGSATHWGSIGLPAGKIVWALLKAGVPGR